MTLSASVSLVPIIRILALAQCLLMLGLIRALYFVDIFLALNNKTTTLYCCSLFCLLLFVGTDYFVSSLRSCANLLSVDENNYCTSERSGSRKKNETRKRMPLPSGLVAVLEQFAISFRPKTLWHTVSFRHFEWSRFWAGLYREAY